MRTGQVPNALARLTESIDASDLNLARALLTMAPRFADQNARIAAGALHPLSITENLAQALQKLADLRARGESVQNWLAQDRIPGIGDDPGPVTTTLVQSLHSLRQKPRQLLDTLDRYAKAVESAGDPRQMAMFGEEKPTRETLWKLAVEWKQPTLAMGSKRVAPSAAEQEFKAQRQRQILKTAASAYSKILQRQWGLITTEEFTAVWNHKPSPFEGGEDATKWLKLNYFSRYIIPAYLGKSWSTEARITPETMHLAVETARQQPDAAAQRGNAELSRLQSNGKLVKGQDGFWNETPLEWLNSQSASLPVSSSQNLPPKTALKLYHTLSAKPERTVPQQQALERAERSLGQLFLFDTPNPSLQPAADLILEQQTASRATFADSSPQQLKLFMANKKALYSKAAQQKHLRPITRLLVKLRTSVQDALVQVVQETVIPKIPARLRALMDQAATDYDAWLKPRMAALKPQWDAYKARFTPPLVDAYNDKLEAIARDLGGVMPMTRVPLKGDRGMEKAILDASNQSQFEGREIAPDVTTVNDVLRASLVAADDDGVARAVEAIRARFKVVKFKDRFTHPVGGYHDWNFIVEVAPGLNAEVQVHRIDYLFSKEIGPGHLMYEDWRRLKELERVNSNPEIARFLRRVSKAMEMYYTSIGQAFTISRKRASSITTPSFKGSAQVDTSSPDLVASIGTGGWPSKSQATGSPSTSKNFVPGGNASGIFTPESTPISPANQPVRITTHNISQYAGTVDVTALQGRQKDWRQAFDWQPGVPVVPLAKLVSPKNELEDPKFKAGLKKDPRQNAADWLLKAINGVAGAKKRAPLDVSANPDGTYTIHDGNATAQALMLAGWKAVPVNIVPAPTLGMSRKAPNGQPSNLTEAQWHQVRTPQFKAWFGDWEALAEQGRLDDFIQKTLADPAWGGSIEWRAFDADEIQAARQLVGVDATGFTHEINANQIRHAQKQHPDLTQQDLQQLAVVLDAWDYIEAGTPKHGFQSLRYVKMMPDGLLHYVERLFPTSRDKSPRGVIYTAWKESGPSTRSATGKNQRPRYARSAGAAHPQHAMSNGRINPDSVSKVVDENGEPMVVWHGTPYGGFRVFNESENGIWLAESRDVAASYTHWTDEWEGAPDIQRFDEQYQQGVVPVFLNVRNLLTVDFRGKGALSRGKSPSDHFRHMAKARDGLRIINTKDRGDDLYGGIASEGGEDTLFAVRRSTQIKSATANSGAFDGTNPSILAKATTAPNLPVSKQPAAAAIAAAGNASAKPYPSQLPANAGKLRKLRERLEQRRADALRAWRGLTTGDKDAIAAAFENNNGRISSLLHEFIQQGIPGFDIRGAIIESPRDFAAYNLAVRTPYFESVKIAVLGDGRQVIHSQIVHVGSLSESIFSPVLIAGIIDTARLAHPKLRIEGFLIAHNHPSGDTAPSDSDRRSTRRLLDIAYTIDVPFLDHVVTNGSTYFSFREHGIIHPSSTVAESGRSRKPKLPILPVPADRPGLPGEREHGILADWEVVPSGDTGVRQAINEPWQMRPLLEQIGTADPAHHHLLYFDSRNKLRAVERIPAGTQNIAALAITGAAREGASGIAIGFAPRPPSSSSTFMTDAETRIHRRLRDAMQVAGVRYLDAGGFDTSSQKPWSAQEMGLMEDSAANDATLGMSRKAPNGQPSNLTEAQWHQVRTPQFKAWFGDWQRAAVESSVFHSAPQVIRVPDEWKSLSLDELRQRVSESLLKEVNTPLLHPEIGTVALLKNVGVKKMLSASRDPAKLFVAGDLRQAFSASRLLGESAPESFEPDVQAYEKLLARVHVAGRTLAAIFTVRRMRDGRQFYNTVTLEEEATPAVSPGDTPASGKRATPAYAEVSPFIRQPYRRINPDSVSKVVDENGEPQVVYHGTTTGGFDTFKSKHLSKVPGTYWFSDNRNLSKTYAGRGEEIIPAPDEDGYHEEERGIYSVFLNIRKAHEFDFGGANWDGTVLEPTQFELLDENGDVVDWAYSQEDADTAVQEGRAASFEPVTNLHTSTDDEVSQAMKWADGAILHDVEDPGPNSDGYSERGTVYAVFDPTQIKSATANSGAFDGTNPSILAKATTAPSLPVSESQGLFDFNTGLGLDTLLTPRQKEAKLQQSQQLDLFGGLTDERPRTPSPRPARPARPSRPATAPQQPASLGELFADGLEGHRPGGNRPIWMGDRPLGAGQPGSLGGGGNPAHGGGADRPAGADHPPTPGHLHSSQTGLPGSHPHSPDHHVGESGEPERLLLPRRPGVGSPDRNFEVPAGVESLAPATDKAKIIANIEAIRLLKKLEAEGRNATPEEKRTLAAYTGWGAFKEAFNSKYEEDIADYWDGKPDYQRRYMPDWLQSWEKNHRPLHKLLRENMSEEEFASASASTLNSHYTAAPIIRAMWKMVQRLGFKGGRALEPSAGAGHYLGLTPATLADRTQWQTVELDDLSARLLSKLYPEATVNESRPDETRAVSGLGFERARIQNGSLDLIISNVPFHESGPRKKGFPALNLHNFFFAHALDKVKPGGLVAFITSESTMQNNMRQREFIASKGDLVAAFRLPNNAFKGNAGTEVTTDIIILRKPDGTPFQGKAWRNLVEVGRQTLTLTQGKDQTLEELRAEAARTGTIVGKEYFKNGKKAIDVSAPVMVNEYFVNHPQNALGSHTLASTMYRAGGYALVAPDGLDVPAALDALVPSLPENLVNNSTTGNPVERRLADRSDKPFSFKEQDGKILEVQPDGSMEEAEWSTNPAKVKTWRSWKGLSQAIEELVAAETSDASDERIAALRRRLNTLYDTHIATHKPVTRRFANTHKHLDSDPGYPLTAALENELITVHPQTHKKTYSYKKADIFTRRIGRPIVEPSRATDLNDAIEKSLAWKGRLDTAYGSSLIGISREAFTQQALQRPDIFTNPETGLLETSEEYLTGNVRLKLEAAEAAAVDDPRLQKNVDALRAAQPERKEINRISPVLGARWIPAEVYEAFIKDVLHGSDTVEYVPAGNAWIISGSGLYKTEEHGTERKGPAALFKHALDMTEPMVYDGSGENRAFNPTETVAAKTALDKMRRAFIDYVKTSDTPVVVEDVSLPVWEAVENAFNTTQNSHVSPRHTGAYLQFPGLNTDHVRTPAHRRATIARFLSTRRGMMAHGVGSGKTFAQVILAQELRRLGLAKKPVIVVQNSTLGQFANSYLKAYPAAKILVPTQRDFEAHNRKKIVAKIATGNWDAVILPHSQFDRISNKPEAVKAYMDSQIDELMSIVKRTKDKAKVRDLEGMLKRLRDRRQDMLDKLAQRQDATVMWEDLGIDALIMDEAHNYKSLPIVTRMGRVKGVPASATSQRAINFMLKCRDVQARTGGKNIFLATGTPIKNSMAEAYIMMQFMAPDVLAEFGIHNFDDFATTYGQTVTEAEMAWGGTPKMETRFAKFQNGSSLVTMIRSMFDVAFGNAALGLDVPEIKGGAPEMLVVPATPQIDQFNAWTRSVDAAWKAAPPNKKEEFTAVPIQTMAAGIAAALDPRLISPGVEDHPQSKVNTAIRRVLDIYKEGTAKRTTQIIFSDLRNKFSMDYLMPFTGHPFPDTGSEGEFDLYADIKKKLVAAGVPEKEVHLMQSGMKDAQKAALFEKVDNGEIRIIIGSTELLGVGVNIQTRLKAVHHLMPPRDFTPAMMEQRNGRIIRQGNFHAAKVDGKPAWNEEVEVVNYGTEGSMDSAIYGTLARKQRFITQLLMAEDVQDTFDDPTDPVAVNMAEMAARTLGDPDFIRRIELEKELKELRLQSDAFTNEIAGKRARLARLDATVANRPKLIEELQNTARRLASIWNRSAPAPEGVKEGTDISDKAVYQFGGPPTNSPLQTIDTAAKDGSITNKLDLFLLDVSKTAERRGQTRMPVSLTINGHPLTVEVQWTLPGAATPGEIQTTNGTRIANFKGAASLIQTLRRAPADTAAEVERLQRDTEATRQQAEALRAKLATVGTFPDAEKLTTLELEARAVEERLRAKASPPPSPPSTGSAESNLPVSESPVSQSSAAILAMARKRPALIEDIFDDTHADDVIRDAYEARHADHDYRMPEAQRHLSLAPTQHLRLLGNLFRAAAKQPKAQVLGTLTDAQKAARTLEEALRAYKVPFLFTEDTPGRPATIIYLHPPADVPEQYQGPRHSFEIQSEGPGQYSINSLMGAGAHATRLYQAIYTWAHNNGHQIVPDSGYTADGAFRRLSHMLSSALRHGTTRHFLPHSKQIPALAAFQGTHAALAEDIGLLAALEADLTLAKAPFLSDIWAAHDLDAALHDPSPAATERIAQALSETKSRLDSENRRAPLRVGQATAKRAFLAHHRLDDRTPRTPRLLARQPDERRQRESLLTEGALYMAPKAPAQITPPTSYADASPDPYTGTPSLIHGRSVPASAAQAIYRHLERVLTSGSRPPGQPGPGAGDARSLRPPLVNLADFGFPGTDPRQSPTSGTLEHIGGAAEAVVYADRQHGTVYKFLHGFQGTGSKGAYPQPLYTAKGQLTWKLKPAPSLRALTARVALMNAVGGTPTELFGVTPQGHYILKQPLSSDPETTRSYPIAEELERNGLIPIPPSVFDDPKHPPAWIAVHRGKPWLFTDLRRDNFIGDTQNAPRIADPLVAPIIPRLLAKVPSLHPIVQQAAARAKTLGDRSDRLFMANKVLQNSPSDGTVAALHEFYLQGTDARTLAAEILGRPDFAGAAAESLAHTGAGHSGTSTPAAENSARIQRQRQQLLAFAYQSGLVMDGAKITAWMDSHKIQPGREHRVAFDTAAARVVKTVAVNEVKTVGADGSMIPSTPYAYLTDHLISNLLWNDDITLEGFYHAPVTGSLHIVISQPFILGHHPTTEKLRQWQAAQTHGISMLDVKPANAIEDAQGQIHPIDFHYHFPDEARRAAALARLQTVNREPGTANLFKATTAPGIATRAYHAVENLALNTLEGSFSAGSALTRATGTENPLQKLGWNHLDRHASAKLAALTRWADAHTGASQLVAKWYGASPQKLKDAAHALKREFFPDSVLPREILAHKREMEIKTALGSQRAMDLVRALSSHPKFSDIAYPPEFATNPLHRRHLYEAMTGERPLTSLPPALQTLATRSRLGEAVRE